MKKLVFLVLVLSGMILLFGCDTPADVESDVSDIESDVSSVETSDENTFLEKIVDDSVFLSFEPEGDKEFFEDNYYIYSFSFPKSGWVWAHYTDGTKEDIKTALENGNVQITDLDRFDIDYDKEAKLVTFP